MESLAFIVVCVFVAVNLCGPGALILAHFKLDVLAVITAAAALVLGVQWFISVFTWARYLGLVSVCMGALAMGIVLKRWLS
jgi:hypothetical protein